MMHIAMLHVWPCMDAELLICMHTAILILTRPQETGAMLLMLCDV